jgi:ABC-type multidrug transport system fused ATPase/permease subunit
MTFQRSTIYFILGLIILIEVANALLGNLVAAFFQEKLGANLGLVLVPLAVLVAILFGFEMSNRLREHTTKEIRAEPASDRNRAVMLDKVENFWVRGVLNQSLYQIARLELGLEQAPEKIGHPWQTVLQQATFKPTVPAGTPIIKLFDDLDGKLLILGAPGSGKTTLLLELARDLRSRSGLPMN